MSMHRSRVRKVSFKIRKNYVVGVVILVKSDIGGVTYANFLHQTHEVTRTQRLTTNTRCTVL